MQGLTCYWLPAALPRQQASTTTHLPGWQPGGAVLIGLWNSSMHLILSEPLPSRCQPVNVVYSPLQPARVLRHLARLPFQLAGARARPSRWPPARRIKAHWKLISMPTLPPKNKVNKHPSTAQPLSIEPPIAPRASCPTRVQRRLFMPLVTPVASASIPSRPSSWRPHRRAASSRAP